MLVGGFPCLFGIAACNGIDNFLMLLRLSLESGKIIVVDVSESECQFLYLRNQLNKSLVPAAAYYFLMESFIPSDYIFDIS